jgi:hypothetical protein
MTALDQVKRAETPAPPFLVGQASLRAVGPTGPEAVPAKKEIPKQFN